MFDHQYFAMLDPDTFARDVNPTLGITTWDTGWQAMPSEFVCTGNQSYRTLWWGDLRLTFETGADAQTRLTAWSLGDPIVSALAPLGAPPPATKPPTGIITTDGVGIGSSLDELEVALGDRGYTVNGNRVDIPGALVTSFLLDDQQRVTAIGSGRVDCVNDSQV